MPHKLPAVPRLGTVRKRLQAVFTEGVNHRNYCVRDAAARTIWVMAYAAAVEGTERWIRPSMVTDMDDRQAAKLDDQSREQWYRRALAATKKRSAKPWFAPNSREQIRDETLRLGLIPNGAVIERKGLATTSAAPRYALGGAFAALFDEDLSGATLDKVIETWRQAHLSKAALARIALIRKGVGGDKGNVLVTYPNGHTRTLAPGPSSIISKAVIEEFAPRYLEQPAVLWLSESASKVRETDRELAAALNLKIDPARDLPDMILIDLGRSGAEVLVVFVEIVATDGPITEARKTALTQIALGAGFELPNLAFLTAFQARGVAAFRRTIPDLALGSFIWFMAEPEVLMVLRNGKPVRLSALRQQL